MATAYIDIFTYTRAVTGLEIDSLVGCKGRVSSAVHKNDTSLPVAPSTSVALKQFDQVTIFDGLNTEVCMVASDTNVGVSNIPLLTGLQFDHAQYTTYCTDGTMGSLADELIEASQWIENITQQSLYQQSYTSETLDIPSMRASIDNRGMLVFRPRHFPISAEDGITIQSSVLDPVTYDAAQIILNGAKQVVKVPWLLASSQSQQSSNAAWGSPVSESRGSNLFLLIDYTAGWSPLPGDIRDCAVLLTSEILARRQNPSGAVSIRLGDKQLQVTGQRDELGESLLVKAAKQKLQPYSVEAF